MQNRFRFVMWSALLLTLFVAACGTKNAGVSGPGVVQQQGQRESAGVTVGGFEVVRFNQQGHGDSTLNGTLQVALQNGQGEKALVISVNDSNFTDAVNTEVRFDPTQYHPVRTVFTGLMGDSSKVLTASFLDSLQGVAGVGSVAVGDYKPGPLSGQFATVYFAPGPDRDVSAVGAGDANGNPAGVGETLANVSMANLSTDSTVANTIKVTWTAAWMIGDGDSNNEVNIADLTPMGKVFKHVPTTDFKSTVADYDRNDEVNAADLTPIGKNYHTSVTGYQVDASDDDGTGKVTVKTLDAVADRQAAVGPPDPAHTPDPLTTLFPFYQLTFDANSAFTYAQLAALNVNNDGSHLVQLTITPIGQPGKANGAPASTTVPVGTQVVTNPNQLIITGFQVEANTGGATPTDIATLDDTTPSLSVLANSGLGFKLKTIKGSFNGTDFDGADPSTLNKVDGNNQPVGIQQADYDAAFNAAVANTIWTMTTGGDAAARRTSDFLTFGGASSSPYLGVLPTTGTVFPDYDPESSATDSPPDPEGTMSVTLPLNGASLPGGGTAQYPNTSTPAPGLKVSVVGQPVVSTFHIDVTVDPTQATLPPYTDDTNAPMTALILNRRNVVYMNLLKWGVPTGQTDPTPPADLSTVSMQLCRIDSTGQVTGTPTPFSYLQTIDLTQLNPGQFTVFKGAPDPGTGKDTYLVRACVGGSALVQGGTYAFRMNVGGEWSSINLPTDTLTTAPPPPPQPLQVAPSSLVDANDQIQVFYADGIIRRNGDMTAHLTGPPTQSAIFAANDQTAFDDVLRKGKVVDGDLPEFVPTIDPNVPFPPNPTKDYYPIVVVKKVSDGPITGPDDPNQFLGAAVMSRGAGRIVVDVAGITTGGNPGDPKQDYNLEVFDQGGVELGTGTFSYDPFGFSPGAPGNVEWGVNVFNREDRAMSDRHYDEATVPTVHTVDGSNLKNPVFPVPVLFFEFNGGWIFDWQQDETSNAPPPTSANDYVILTDTATSRNEQMVMGLRLSGVDATDGEYICIHTLTINDFTRAGFPGWTGVLDPGGTYSLALYDPGTNQTVPFANNMSVVGTNPNT